MTLPRDSRRVLALRGARGFVDGAASVALPVSLGLVGLSTGQVGVIATATMLGSAAATLGVAWFGRSWSRRRLLAAASLLMVATGVGFGLASSFAVLLVVAFVGTLNPSSGDVSVFQPIEHSILPQTVPDSERTALFARYSLVGALLAAFGSLGVGGLVALHENGVLSERLAFRVPYALYAVVGVVSFLVFRRLSPDIEPAVSAEPGTLGSSRPIVLRLAALFSLDSFAGGFTVQSMLALWLFLRFDLSVAVTGVVFFWTSLLTAGSMLVSPWLARRIGLVRTMVFTHIPANVFLILAAFMPNAWLAIGCLMVRSVFATMDVPARTSYVMAVVPPDRRSAASAVTNVPRSLAAAAGPALAGAMLAVSTFGWPLVLAGSLKIVYDLLLLASFGSIRPPEELGDGYPPAMPERPAADNIVLTGFMGTGKTTAGRLLAERLGLEFVDTDAVIEQRHGTIASIFADQGEAAFRSIERGVAAELAGRSGLVISTGGRMLLDPENERVLRSTGVVFCLTAPVDRIVERVTGDPSAVERPLLAGPDPRARIAELLAERAAGYARFPQIDTADRTPAEVVDALLAALPTEPRAPSPTATVLERMSPEPHRSGEDEPRKPG